MDVSILTHALMPVGASRLIRKLPGGKYIYSPIFSIAASVDASMLMHCFPTFSTYQLVILPCFTTASMLMPKSPVGKHASFSRSLLLTNL